MHSDEERARCVCVWVVTRSVHLLKLLEGYPSMYVMMCSSQVICSFHKEAEAAEGVQACGVEWKLQMPSTSRDIALNRASHEKTYVCVLRAATCRHSVGNEGAGIPDCGRRRSRTQPSDRHWRILEATFFVELTAPRMDQNQEFSARDNAAGSQPPQHDFCIDSARGRLGSCYSGSRPRSCGKRPRRVSHCTIVGLRQQAYDLASRVAAGDELRKGVDLDCLHRHSET